MKLAIAGDAPGESLARALTEHLKDRFEVFEVSHAGDPGERYYAEIADRVASGVLAGAYDRAILICGTGLGMSISANKVPGIRAALAHDAYSAQRAALSNNAQIITMGARVIGVEHAKVIADTFLGLTDKFDANGPSAKNVQAIEALDAKYASKAAAE